jgi:ElaB/YqjD/DUF883 family membrane-anchored ribosome-binding protein
MTEMTHAPPVGGEQSTTDQAKEKAQEAASQVQQQVGQKAQQVRGQASDTIRQQLDSRSTQAGEQVSATADALRRVGGQLRQEGNATPAQYAERAAEPVERLGRYLTDADGNRILSDAEQFARRRPWVTVLGGATLGFFVARFIKASGTQDGAAMQHGAPMPNDPYGQPALPPAPSGQMGAFDGHDQ